MGDGSIQTKERFMGTPAVARLLGLSGPTVRRLAESGTLPGAFRFGRVYRFKRESVEAFKRAALLSARNGS